MCLGACGTPVCSKFDVIIYIHGFEQFRGVYERLVGCVRQAAFVFWIVPSNEPIYGALSVCWLCSYRLLRFAVRFELRRGTVGETVEFEHE